MIKYSRTTAICPEQIKSCITYFDNLFLKKLREQRVKVWIAGGAVRNYLSGLSPLDDDVDLFFPNEDALKAARNMMHPKFIYENDKVIKCKTNLCKIDFVKTYFQSPSDTIDAFDFTVCCVATDGVNLVCHDSFFMDLAAKRLQINNLPFPLSSLQRLQKYVKKGYTACNGTLLTLAKGIKEIDMGDKNQNNLSFYPDGTPRFIRYD